MALLCALASSAHAQSAGNLPGAEDVPAATPASRPRSVAEHNKAAAALRAAYDRDVAAYQAALRAHARDAASAAADAESFRHAKPLAVPIRAAAVSPPATDITVTGERRKRTCITVGGQPATGSLIVRAPPRLRCFDTVDEERAYAQQRDHNDREARELIRPKAGNMTTLPEKP